MMKASKPTPALGRVRLVAYGLLLAHAQRRDDDEHGGGGSRAAKEHVHAKLLDGVAAGHQRRGNEDGRREVDEAARLAAVRAP